MPIKYGTSRKDTWKKVLIYGGNDVMNSVCIQQDTNRTGTEESAQRGR